METIQPIDLEAEFAITPEPTCYGGMNEQGWIPARPETEYALGWDIGQSVDASALALVRRQRLPIPAPEGIGSDLVQRLGDNVYTVMALERLPLGMNYVDQIAIVKNRLAIARQKSGGAVQLVLDQTGVGRAVSNLATLAGLDHIGITIVAGLTDDRSRGSQWKIAKNSIVSRLSAEFHSKSLRILSSLKEAVVLADEIQNFRATLSESTGYATFGARSGKHDDLVLALGIALIYLAPVIDGAWQAETIDF